MGRLVIGEIFFNHVNIRIEEKCGYCYFKYKNLEKRILKLN